MKKINLWEKTFWISLGLPQVNVNSFSNSSIITIPAFEECLFEIKLLTSHDHQRKLNNISLNASSRKWHHPSQSSGKELHPFSEMLQHHAPLVSMAFSTDFKSQQNQPCAVCNNLLMSRFVCVDLSSKESWYEESVSDVLIWLLFLVPFKSFLIRAITFILPWIAVHCP